MTTRLRHLTRQMPGPLIGIGYPSRRMSADRAGCRGCQQRRRLSRREFVGLLSTGLGLLAAGCSRGRLTSKVGLGRPPTAAPQAPDAQAAAIVPDPSGGPPLALDAVPQPHPGSPQVISSGPKGTQQIALTIDDGYCGDCVNKYVEFAQKSGIHITFNPNGVYGSFWTPLLDIVQPMIADRQVQIGNHTWNHANLLTLSTAAIIDEINRNEDWIQRTFGVTARPWFRPPYGYYDSHVIDVAGSQGYTNILMWNGSFGDSTVISPQQLLGLANEYLKPGTIMLGHLNHPTILSLFDQIEAIIAERGLEPVTLDEMFGTSRSSG